MNNPTPPRIIFQWDEGNLSKMELVKASGRDFFHIPDELESVFYDPYQMRETSEPDAKTGEPRLRLTGLSNQNRVISVIFVIRDGQIRIFNAMRAKQARLKRYHERKAAIESEGPIRP